MVIAINNVLIIIFKITTSKSLVQKSQTGIALTFFIEIVDKELLKYKVENIRWGHTCMIDEHRKAITFLSFREKGLFWRKVPNNMTVVLHACFVKVTSKARLCMSKTLKSQLPSIIPLFLYRNF